MDFILQEFLFCQSQVLNHLNFILCKTICNLKTLTYKIRENKYESFKNCFCSIPPTQKGREIYKAGSCPHTGVDCFAAS